MKNAIASPKIKEYLSESTLQELINEEKIYNCNFLEGELQTRKVTALEFNECKFNKLTATGKEFYNTQFIDVIFDKCDFSNTTFELCLFTRCKFINCKLLGVNMINSSLQNVLFDGMISYSNFANNKFNKVLFKDAFLDEARFLENSFANIYFDKCQINRIEFSKCDLSKVDLSTCNFDDIKVNPTELRGIKLSSYQACIIARKLGIIIEG